MWVAIGAIGASRNKHPAGVHTLSLGFLESQLSSWWCPSIQGIRCVTRPLHVWYDPVPRAHKHGNYLESAMSVGAGLILNGWLDPQETGIWLTHTPLQGCGGSGGNLDVPGQKPGCGGIKPSLVMLSAVSRVPGKSGRLYLFPNWGWWWQIQQSVKLPPFWMFECYFLR